MKDFLQREYFGNSVENMLIALGIIVVGIILIHILKAIVDRKAQKEVKEQSFYKFIIKSIKKFIIPIFYLGIIYIGIQYLTLPPEVYTVFRTIGLILGAYFIVRFAALAINFFIMRYLEKEKRPEDQNRIRPLISFINFLIWIIGLIFLLDNLGFEISSIVAGLGIGGIAVALAAQAVLGDLFSYFTIFFDKPFEIGDFLVFNDKFGSVEKIGVKSTRIRSLSGEQIIVSNSNLTNSIVHNYKRMEKRRIVFTVGVIYQTKYAQVKEIPELIKNSVNSIDLTMFDRSHFKGYGDFSLNFETVYYVQTSDYNKYMDIQQEINLKLYEEFEKRGIEFAYPTQTLFMNKLNGEEKNNAEVQ